jgi:hypothetical protein
MGAYILPDKLSDLWEAQRDFGHAKIPLMNPSTAPPHPSQPTHAVYKNPLQTLCGWTRSSMTHSGSLLLMVVTSEGYLYQFGVDEAWLHQKMTSSASIPLLRQFSLMEG